MKTTLKIFSRTFEAAIRNVNVRLSLLFTVILILISTVLLTINSIGKTYNYNLGEIAREDVRVPRDILYEIEAETKIKRMQVAEGVPLIFEMDQSVIQEKIKLVDMFFSYVQATLREVPSNGTEDRTFQFMTLKSRLPAYIHYNDRTLYNILRYPDTAEIKGIIKRILIFVMDRGVLNKPYDNPLKISNKNVAVKVLNSTKDNTTASGTLENIKTFREVKGELYGICRSLAPPITKDYLKAVYNVVQVNIKPNLFFNAEETRLRIDETISVVDPVMGVLKKGQMLIREGDAVTTEVLSRIGVLNKYTSTVHYNYILGIIVLQLSFAFIFGYFLLFYYKKLVPDFKTPVIVFSLILLFMMYTFFISRFENIADSKMIFSLFLPIAVVTMTASSLFNMFIAMLIGLYVTFYATIAGGGSIEVMIISFSSALLGIVVLKDLERRSDVLRAGLILGIINSIVVIGVSLMAEYPLNTVLKNMQLSLGNGILTSILVLGMFPLFENVFGLTTTFSLLELSDLNAGIFRKMLIQAPGTYNHSIMVACMSESACKEIGANYLLARVGSYFHDIGKIEDAGIYIENKISGHETEHLSPQQYSKLIISHVEKGVELARQIKLPEQIIDFIREHHGESIMTYFYHQALEQAHVNGEEDKVSRSDFRYPGPRPRSRETAVVMLADSIEAASRSLDSPTYIKLEAMVQKIIYTKLNEGELENAELTMADLNKIEEAFLQVMNGIFHSRIEYPDQDEVLELEKKVLKKRDAL